MKSFAVKNKFIPRGKITLFGDKSIAHRALIISALSCGKTIINNFPIHDDSLATLNVLAALGVKITRDKHQVYVCGGQGLRQPKSPVFVDNSGTTLRLILGVLAGTDFKTKLIAGKYLSARPMSRVNNPLRLMGAKITARKKGQEEYPPITINGKCLKGILYRLPVASAQVKSAILLAGLFASGKTCVVEGVSTRDHTERMLKYFGADISINKNRVILNPGRCLSSPGSIYIPGDISSAAFFLVLGLIIPGSKIVIQRSSLNPGRVGIIQVLKRMGAKIKIEPLKGCKQIFEPMGNLTVSSGKLKGTLISRAEVPSLIDELPVLMVAACFAEGKTIIKGAGELRFKETDRINSMITNLRSMGADIRLVGSGSLESIIINGKGFLMGAELKSFADHRTAMSMVVAALAAKGNSRLDDVSCISKSFPGFLTALKGLS
ncbi:MAG: 3-phosphoshikimate 1-carboxyvinyltransferase [Candidatus Omnitrophica bacterium]|jgi:3-phosphoshikimate 1-carboxyvinyltransferase|nr:3-phosphoshikimate 1-carboxyvinyltransferase [Candidatus Omnitrophota bacterium]